MDSGNEGIVGDKMAPLIMSIAENDDIDALVLRVNSGGGSAFASEQIWEALEQFKATGNGSVKVMLAFGLVAIDTMFTPSLSFSNPLICLQSRKSPHPTR